MTHPREHTLRTVDVALTGGRVLRLALHEEPDGTAELLLCAGFPDQRGWQRLMAEGCCIPAEALPELVEALRSLRGS